MLSSMLNDLISQFEIYTTLKKYAIHSELLLHTSMTRLRQLQMCLDFYKMDSEYTMAEHPERMSSMAHDLNAAKIVLRRSSKFKLYCALYQYLTIQ